jgi:hypothetical protein
MLVTTEAANFQTSKTGLPNLQDFDLAGFVYITKDVKTFHAKKIQMSNLGQQTRTFTFSFYVQFQ